MTLEELFYAGRNGDIEITKQIVLHTDVKPVDKMKQIFRMLTTRSDMTMPSAAEVVGLTLGQLLDLAFGKQRRRISSDLMEAIKGSRISFVSAYIAAKLPVNEQAEFIARPSANDPSKFGGEVAVRVQELRLQKA